MIKQKLVYEIKDAKETEPDPELKEDDDKEIKPELKEEKVVDAKVV